MMEQEEVLFEETQHFRQWWLWLIVILCCMPLAVILIWQVTSGEPVGDKPASTPLILALILLINGPMVLLFAKMRLRTVIIREGIRYGFIFGKGGKLNLVKWEDIEEMALGNYKFLGYGYRFSKQYGTIYNVSGDKAMFLTLKKHKKKLLIGTNRFDELERVMAAAR